MKPTLGTRGDGDLHRDSDVYLSPAWAPRAKKPQAPESDVTGGLFGELSEDEELGLFFMMAPINPGFLIGYALADILTFPERLSAALSEEPPETKPSRRFGL